MVRPTAYQTLIASGKPLMIWQWSFAIGAVFWVARSTEVMSGLLFDRWTVLWMLTVSVIAFLIGWFFAIPVAHVVLGPIYHAQSLANGAPFHPGDRVQIIAGPHRGKICTVYSKWQRDSVRVDLGSEHKAEYDDIYAPYQLIIVEPSEC